MPLMIIMVIPALCMVFPFFHFYGIANLLTEAGANVNFQKRKKAHNHREHISNRWHCEHFNENTTPFHSSQALLDRLAQIQTLPK